MKDLRARIGGKTWRFKWLPLRYDGQARRTHRIIELRQSLSGKRLLETLIHEVLHAEHWQIDEDYVHETAADLARILWRLGFRRQDE